MASFENAEIWGSLISDLPTPAIVIDVDEILNIDGLEGRLLPSRGPLDLYEFRGKTGDGSSIHAHAAVLGRWMYMRGFTEPPPGSADFFEYRFHTLARRGPSADVNDDGIVDAADFVAIRDTDRVGRDIRNNLTIGAGLSDWRQQFGEAAPDLTAMDAMLSSALSSFVTVASVPEPASWCLAIFVALLITGLRRQAGIIATSSYGAILIPRSLLQGVILQRHLVSSDAKRRNPQAPEGFATRLSPRLIANPLSSNALHFAH